MRFSNEPSACGWDQEFESDFLQRGVLCEPDSLDQDGENLPSGFKLTSSNSRRRGLEGVSIPIGTVHPTQTSRFDQSETVASGPHRSAISAGSG